MLLPKVGTRGDVQEARDISASYASVLGAVTIRTKSASPVT